MNQFNNQKQDLPPHIQKMLDDSPVIAPNDGKGYVVHATPKELFDMGELKKKWDKLTTDEAMDAIEKILGSHRMRVFAKAFLERKPIRLSANDDPRRAQMMNRMNREARRRMMKSGRGRK